jgi:hypothetical protein
MITARELRIGNLVMSIAGGGIRRVDAQVIEGLYESEGSDFLTGIPLTDDWLGRTGFQRSTPTSQYYYYKVDANISITKEPYEYLLYFNEEPLSAGAYVHTLQNAFFDLTGQELTVTV